MPQDMSFAMDDVLAIFRRFSRLEHQDGTENPGYEVMAIPRIRHFYESKEPIRMLLPAAPFKNPCPDKVLDPKSPDFAEELGLCRLNDLCYQLGAAYPYGAEVTMVSDGPVYNGKFWS